MFFFRFHNSIGRRLIISILTPRQCFPGASPYGENRVAKRYERSTRRIEVEIGQTPRQYDLGENNDIINIPGLSSKSQLRRKLRRHVRK